MNRWLVLAGLLVVAAVPAQAPGLLLVAAVALAYGSLTRLWTRFGTQRVEYGRRLSANRAVAGDMVGLDVTIWNRKPLPLPWVAADDMVGDGLTVREQPQLDRDNELQRRRILRNAWSLTWYERVVRHFHLDDVRRGTYDFGPVRLRVRDILGRDAIEGEVQLDDRLVVAPRTLPVRRSGRDVAPIGERRARRSLFVDPALYAGVRPFQPGDSLRRIHRRASARLGQPVSRRYEPARGREVILTMDVQTLPGPHWQMTWDEAAFEALCTAAASLARRLLDEGASVGLAAASFSGTPQRFAWLAPQAAPAQLARVGAMLARIGPVSSSPFAAMLTWLTRRLPPGATVVVLTARDPRPHLPPLRRMAAGGYSVQVVSFAAEAAEHASLVRAAGLGAVAATFIPSPDQPDAIVLAQ